MDPVIGEPFQEHEKRYMLTEALRASTIPLERLYIMLQEANGPPAWDDMVLPRGRTLKQCKAAFESLRPALPPPLPPHPVHAYPAPTQPFQIPPKRKSESAILGPPYMQAEPPAKRRQSGMEPMVGARDIRPKPPNGGSPISMSSTPPTAPQKRRGRPPKAEVDRRNRDAMQRGEVFPAQFLPPTTEEFATSPYTPIAPTPPVLAPGPPTPQGYIEQTPPDTQAEDSPGRKKRPKAPPKPKAAPPRQPGEGSFSVNPQLPIVREPHVHPPVPNIAAITELEQTGPSPQSAPSVMPSPVSATIEAATSAESQPSAQAAS
ncbi:uncharacterized protein LY89DRAFT_192736 [Mollisia scopiformis]|uniref:Uncharacterized protein n=1 Tax=Mollisia scopiformis TaxID=149040 RepID=A0A194WYV8_MOLSC|nr:uncharacterized protein LY89DRAFT_192736 [Mollisia scopiformis]KUJ12777.1 hypothetical protein LY89DRAFT_192736 [Mollisia scopiformis]